VRAVYKDMTKVRVHISMSLDGYVAGPNQSEQNPLGEGGEQLHDWVTRLKAWRKPHGMEGGEDNVSSAIVQEEKDNVGAEIMGRGMFGPPEGVHGSSHGRAGGVRIPHSTSPSSSSPITSASR
jgi:hypothetical protein